jgi:hypothetical protein
VKGTGLTAKTARCAPPAGWFCWLSAPLLRELESGNSAWARVVQVKGFGVLEPPTSSLLAPCSQWIEGAAESID